MKYRNLKFQLTVAFNLVILLVIAALGVTLGVFMRHQLLERAEESMRFDVKETESALDYFFSIYLSKSDAVFLDTELAVLLDERELNLVEQIAARNKILNKITRQVAFDLKYPEVRGSYYFGGSTLFELYVKNGDLVDNRDFLPYDALESKPWYTSLMTRQRMFSWNTGEHRDGNHYVAFNRRLLDMQRFEDIAVLKVMIPYAKIRNVLEQNLGQHSEAFIYSDEDFSPIVTGGAALAVPDDERLGALLPDTLGRVVEYASGGETYLINSTRSDLTGWHLTYIVPRSEVLAGIDYVKLITVVACLLAILLCSAAATLISSRITRRVNVLVYKTKQVAAGQLDFDETLRDLGHDEISLLDGAINDMAQEIKALHKREFLSKIRINEVRAELMQEQINPHLLYNTLSMIKLIARREQQGEVYALTDQLMNFYKSVLNRGSFVAPINREMFMIRYFVEIARVVYELEIDLEIDVPDDILELYTVKLFLQPLVENAVLHGIRPIGRGQLSIEARREGDSILFTVSDTGVGIETQTLDDINAAMEGDIYEGGRYAGYGVLNVCKRLRLFFGESGGMHISSQVGEGTEILLTVPAFTQGNINHWMDSRRIPDM